MSVESGGNSGGGGGGCGGYQGSIRPGSMADRARLAKIHQVDAVLKCPRCESTNTKFCYYNNYNLSQPRHFCKTCRRYWTRGGALRNVPVGGGCRRNKRSKGNNTNASKSHVAGGSSTPASANSSSNNGCTTTTTTTTNSNGNMVMGHLPTQFPFLSSLQHYSNTNNSDYLSGGIGSHFGTSPTSSLVAKNIGNSSSSSNAEFQIGNGSSNGGNLLLSNGIGEQWRFPNMQQIQQHQQQQQQQQQQRQFAFMTNLEPQIGLFPFGHNNGENNVAEPSSRFISSKAMDSSSINTIKMEKSNQQGMNLPKNLLSGSGNSTSNLFWNGGGSGNNAWSEVPSFTPSPSHY